MFNKKPVVIGITGASGVIYSFKLLEFLLEKSFNVDLIITEMGQVVIQQELNLNITNLNPEGKKTQILNRIAGSVDPGLLSLYANEGLCAPMSSGSYETQGMIILPCSMNTLAAIHAGMASNLITRAADTCLKQGKKLVIAPREVPFNTIHLRNMHALSAMGVKIVVPAPAFYNHPHSIDDMINYVTGKILDVFEVPNELYTRWK
jgi:flavin prenyltransferase